MTRDVAKYVKDCEICKRSKPQKMTKQPMILTKTPTETIDTIIIDTIGPMTKSHSGNEYALTMTCDMSKFLVVAPMPTKTTKDVAKSIFEKFILIQGPMREIRTDKGTEFDSNLMNELCKLLGITHKISTAYRHETVGTAERCHRVYNEYLRSYLEEKSQNWDNYLDYFAFNYNISKNSTTDYKYSPYEIVYKKKPVPMNDILTGNVDPIYNVENYVKESKFMMQQVYKDTVEILDKIKEQNKRNYDKTANLMNIEKGDFVRVKQEPYHKHKLI